MVHRDPIFHTLYDLDERFQVPGAQYLRSGRTYENDGFDPRWRGIFDDKNRIMVAICHNMDLGDAWVLGAGHLEALIQIVQRVENRIAVFEVHDRPARKDLAHARDEHVPFPRAMEVIDHQESAPKQEFTQLPCLAVR
ncbi:MAG: hypothetical protein DMG59_05545 [Acidobacteria bacterium]|nr:MAG: hypothetical protein DMG59_05545 [Acidobacteriota bacterium]